MGLRGPKPGQYKMRPLPAGAAAAGGRAGAGRFVPGVPDCPPWLSAAARKVWRSRVAELEAAGTIAAVDADLLAAYCTAAADLAAVAKSIGKDGVSVEVPTLDRNGKPTGHVVWKPNPLLKTQDALMGRVRQLADSLGIGHSARVRQGTAGSPEPPRVNAVLAIRDRIQAARAAHGAG